MKFNWQKTKWTWTIEKLQIIHPLPELRNKSSIQWLENVELEQERFLKHLCTRELPEWNKAKKHRKTASRIEVNRAINQEAPKT